MVKTEMMEIVQILEMDVEMMALLRMIGHEWMIYMEEVFVLGAVEMEKGMLYLKNEMMEIMIMEMDVLLVV